MNWPQRIALSTLLAAIAVNTVLTVQLEYRRAELRKEAAKLTTLADEVSQKSTELKALADSLPPCGPNKGAAPAPKSGRDYVAATDNHCAVIHKPKAGCPKGYVQEKRPSFTEKDGSRVFACVSDDPAKAMCIDELRPGESVEMHLFIPLIPEAPEPVRVEGPRT